MHSEGVSVKHHTFVCGSAKSKQENRYYIKAENRFGRSLYEVAITDRQLKPKEYRILGRKYGIYLTEIVDPDKYIIDRDEKIEPYHLKDGFKKLLARIKDEKPKRIGFVGKNAATWFYRHVNGMELTKCNHHAHGRTRRNLGDYGQLDWKHTSPPLPGNIECWLLTNTHRHWKKEVWLDFWRSCKYDVNRYVGIL